VLLRLDGGRNLGPSGRGTGRDRGRACAGARTRLGASASHRGTRGSPPDRAGRCRFPFGIASFRIAGYVLWPFGRTTRERPDAGGASFVGNVIWLIFAGWWLALGHLATSIALAVTIVGIPFAWANLKLIPISLMPLGREIVPSDQPFAAR